MGTRKKWRDLPLRGCGRGAVSTESEAVSLQRNLPLVNARDPRDFCVRCRARFIPETSTFLFASVGIVSRELPGEEEEKFVVRKRISLSLL